MFTSEYASRLRQTLCKLMPLWADGKSMQKISLSHTITNLVQLGSRQHFAAIHQAQRAHNDDERSHPQVVDLGVQALENSWQMQNGTVTSAHQYSNMVNGKSGYSLLTTIKKWHHRHVGSSELKDTQLPVATCLGPLPVHDLSRSPGLWKEIPRDST